MEDYSKKMLIGAIVPLCIFLLAMLNNFLLSKGLPCLNIGDSQMTEIVTYIVEFISALFMWYKNNNVTPEAQQAQIYLDQLKNE